eukprot:CAMPEP_0174726452 /NCGR_PEP_ID=MMETSP1094-20130205/47838_1 /TAXON_ID=156173 /ORGANISM="Chrysochromulina brevifilum, Strain UTEX LB 985" /LENGTH=337 /DNA_ID=CAMNT_0015928039 /DNA_START=32 /DNA_END=1045 /DNA_ORIENTATION=+
MVALQMLCVALGLLSSAEALTPCCVTRMSGSRIAASPVLSRAAVCLCDAGEEAAPAAVAEEAAAVVEEVAAEPVATEKPQSRSKGAKTPLEELEAGAEVEGKIRSVMPYGAFVDVGASTDGLLHVSEISNEFIKDATEKLTAGDSITCRIKAVNLEKQQLALTCKDPAAAGGGRGRKERPDLTEYESADEKAFVTGTVNSITDFGAFVTLKEGVDGLVHISQIQEGGVGKVSDVLTIGQEVQVRIVKVEKEKRRIALSMKEWSEQSAKEERAGRKGGGRSFDSGFGEADKEFHMSAEDIETLSVGDEFSSPFDQALSRAAYVKEVKQSKGKYAAQVL